VSYIGNTVTTVPFITDTFSGNSATVNFTLTRAPAGSAAIAVFIAGVYQAPTAYSVSGTTLTFGSAPIVGTNNIVVLHLGNGSATQVPSDGSVTLTKLSSDTYGYINSAFSAANTGSSSGSSAASYANSAFLQANTPSYLANSAGSYANSGFTSANSAGSYANSGFAVANSAASYANSGFAAANTKATTSSPTFTGTVVMANANTTVINVQNQLAVYGFAFQNVVTLTDATTITVNLAQTNNFTVTLGGNRTMANATNITAGQSGFIVVRQDGTGSRTLSFGTGWRFPSNTAPTLTTTASAVDLLVYVARDSGNLVTQLVSSTT
jgi:hypothetical protein